jgi:hypothetical protein
LDLDPHKKTLWSLNTKITIIYIFFHVHVLTLPNFSFPFHLLQYTTYVNIGNKMAYLGVMGSRILGSKLEKIQQIIELWIKINLLVYFQYTVSQMP